MFNLCLITLIAGFSIGHFKMRYGGWAPYLVIEGLVGLLVLVTIVQLTRDRDIFRRIPVTKVYVFLCAYSITAVVRPDVPLFSGLMGYRALLVCPALLFTGYLAFEYPRQLQRTYSVLAVLGVITASIGLYQWQVGPDVVATWGGHYAEFARRMLWTRLSQEQFVFRAFSTFVQPGVFGATMASVMLTVLAQLMSPRVGVIRRGVLVAAFGLMGAGMLVSASRLSIVIVTFGAIVMVFLKGGVAEKSKRLFQAAVVLIATLWIALQYAGPAFVERLQSVGTPQAFFFRWFNPTVEGLRRGTDTLIGFGLGYTSGLPYFVTDDWLPRNEVSFRNIDSGIGAVAQELGLPGVILYLTFTMMVATTAIRTWRSLPSGQVKDMLLAPTALAVVAVPLLPIANMMIASYPVAIIYWFLIGLLLKAPALQRAPMLRPRPAAYPPTLSPRFSPPRRLAPRPPRLV